MSRSHIVWEKIKNNLTKRIKGVCKYTLLNLNTMKKSSRILILISVLSLTAVYFVPLWNIELEAPQYPEGLGMQIWLSKITGDLQTINGLNHYIGMKTIEPDSIQELTLMPYIIGFIILTGILVFIFNKRSLLFSWILLLIITGAVGMYDFWKWEYEYGHDLDPTAAIKVAGMNYQPPLIGSKQLLNFTAISMPAAGGMIIFAAGVIAILVLIYEFKYNNTKNVKV
jgi:copper chaperone NosL